MTMLIQIIKRTLDIILSSVILILFLPFGLIFALLIYIESPGLIIYKQKRLGKHSSPFMLYKFRTMKLDAETNGVVYPQGNDPRVLKIGKFLRSTRLDEIPNFINVLRGEMSIVGPRAERPEIYAMVHAKIPGIWLRLEVKPGITGPAQLKLNNDGSPNDGHWLLDKYPRENFTGPMNMQYKLQYDLEYIERQKKLNQSILTDLSVMIKTPLVMFFNRNVL